jgi:hypothetical protein
MNVNNVNKAVKFADKKMNNNNVFPVLKAFISKKIGVFNVHLALYKIAKNVLCPTSVTNVMKAHQ